MLGFVGFDSVHTTHVYTPDEVALLKLFAEMLVNVLGRQQSEARLHQLTVELEIPGAWSARASSTRASNG